MLKSNIKLKRGDIILIHYNLDPVGWLIRAYTHCHWNHVGWIINNKYLIESCRKGIIITNIEKYQNKFLYEYKIIRLRNINPKKINLAISLAISYRKKISGLYQSITFILLMFNCKRSLPKPTCSGLIAQCLYKIGIKFCSKSPSRITPADICNSKIVREIINE